MLGLYSLFSLKTKMHLSALLIILSFALSDCHLEKSNLDTNIYKVTKRHKFDFDMNSPVTDQDTNGTLDPSHLPVAPGHMTSDPSHLTSDHLMSDLNHLPLPTLVDSLSPSCSHGLRILNGSGILNYLFDSWGKPVPGVLTSAWNWLGDYNECMNISQTSYCKATVHNFEHVFPNLFNNNNQSIELGVCLPNYTLSDLEEKHPNCNSSDVEKLLNYFFNKKHSNESEDEHLTLSKMECSQQHESWSSPAVVVVLCILSLMLLLCLLGTLYDLVTTWIRAKRNRVMRTVSDSDSIVEHVDLNINERERMGLLAVVPSPSENNFCHQFLLCFSLYGNLRRITQQSSARRTASKNLLCLHGLRVLSMVYIMLGHTFYYAQFQFKRNGVVITKHILTDYAYALINGATEAVDTFFLLSGFLQSYLLLSMMLSNGGARKTNWGIIIFHRFWRLTPSYMLILAFYATIFPLLGSGPFWSENTDDAMACRSSWWHNLLYINNLIKGDQNYCMGWTWYMGDEFQFFFASLLFIILLYWKSLVGILATVLVIVSSMIARGVVSTKHDFPPGFIGFGKKGHVKDDQVHHYMELFYYIPWMRVGSFLIGVLIGFIIYKKESNIRLPTLVWLLGWLVSLATMGAVIFGVHHFTVHDLPSVHVSALYNATHRIVWSLAVGWIIIACVAGKAGYINSILSSPVFEKLSNLTFMAYLIHPIIIRLYFGQLQQTLVFNYQTLMFLFVGFTTLGYFFGLVAYLTIEAPFMGLEKLLLKHMKRCCNRNR